LKRFQLGKIFVKDIAKILGTVNNLIMKKILLFVLAITCLGQHLAFSQSVGKVKIKLLGPANLNFRKTPKRVLISDFMVNYQVEYALKDQNKNGEMFRGGLKGDTKASVALTLEGLNPNELQKLTDQLYSHYVEELKSNGYEIAPIEELWNHKLYQKNRDQAWQLAPGTGPAQISGETLKSSNSQVIFTRPTTQKFVFAIPNGKSRADQGIVNAKTDFIYNKVVVSVIVFDDGQSELSKTMNRHAGSAQVKAEANFKIGENSTIQYGMGTINPVGGIEVEGIIEEEKVSVGQGADVDKRGTNMGMFKKFSVENKEKTESTVVTCDPEKYSQGVQLGSEAFFKAAVEKLLDKS
jgi:hypothetical protein